MPKPRQCRGTTAGAQSGDSFGQPEIDIKTVHFIILPATPARQSCPERGPAAMVQGVRVTFPSSKAEGAALMWLSESGLGLLSAHGTRTGNKEGCSPWIPPRVALKEGEIRHEEQTERLVWQPLSLRISPIFTFTQRFFNKKTLISIANNLIVLLIWRTCLLLINFKRKKGKNTAANMKIVDSSHWFKMDVTGLYTTFGKLESFSGLCPVGFWISAERETPLLL